MKEQHAQLKAFTRFLRLEEKSKATIEKYLRDTALFLQYAAGKELQKELVVEYKESLQERGYAPRSVNSMLAGINCFLSFCGRGDCRVRYVKLQRQIYTDPQQELTREDYLKLLQAAKDKPKLRLVMETICSTGIRVSELHCFTVEAVKRQEVVVRCKGKNRKVLLPGKLKKLLLAYAKAQRIVSGAIFVSRGGNPLHRSDVWAQMKALCQKAGVDPKKVFPHNLRKLFARTFYRMEKDIAKLADILGHSSIDTTRIYIMATGIEHRRKLERLGLVL